MFSLHIDTARTWRGGQNQVLLTVNGLRAIGQRAALVAHPRRRAAAARRGRARSDPDRAAHRDGPLGGVAALARAQAAGARRRPRARSARRRDGVAGVVARRRFARPRGRMPALVASRRVDFHLKGNSFSRWKYRQVDCFIAASEAIRQMLVGRRRAGRAHRDGSRRHRRRARRGRAAGQRARGVLAAASRAGRRQRRRAGAAQGPAPPDRGRAPRRAAGSRRALRHPRRRRAARASRDARCASYHLEKHVLLPGFRTDVLGCIKGFDLFAMSSVTEGLGTSLLDAMACARADCRHRGRRHSRDRRRRRDRAAGGAARSRGDGAGDRATAERRPARSGSGWARPDWRACSERFTVERMVAETAAVYATRGRHTPRSGHCASPCGRLKPHAFIMPRWQSEKSYLTGSRGSSRRSDAVMSRAICQPGLV